MSRESGTRSRTSGATDAVPVHGAFRIPPLTRLGSLGFRFRRHVRAPGALAPYRPATDLDPNDWTAWSSLAAVERGEPRRSALAEAARLNPLGGSP